MHRIDRIANANRWRRRSAVEKVALAGAMLALSVTLPAWPASALVLGVMLGAAFFGARISPRAYLRAALPALVFLGLSAASLAWGLAVEPASGLSLRFSAEGAEVAARVALRASAALSCLLFVALTTPLFEVVSLLGRCRVPAAVIEVALLIYHLLFALFDAARSMALAQDARLGYSTLRRSYRSSSLLVAGLLTRTLGRARRLEVGLSARGFEGELAVMAGDSRASRGFLALTLTLTLLISWISVVFGAHGT